MRALLVIAALALLAIGGCVVEPAHLVPDNAGGWHGGWHYHDHDGGWRR